MTSAAFHVFTVNMSSFTDSAGLEWQVSQTAWYKSVGGHELLLQFVHSKECLRKHIHHVAVSVRFDIYYLQVDRGMFSMQHVCELD